MVRKVHSHLHGHLSLGQKIHDLTFVVGNVGHGGDIVDDYCVMWELRMMMPRPVWLHPHLTQLMDIKPVLDGRHPNSDVVTMLTDIIS